MNTRENATDDRDARLEQSDVSDGKERLSETEVWQLSKNTSIATSCSNDLLLEEQTYFENWLPNKPFFSTHLIYGSDLLLSILIALFGRTLDKSEVI